MRQTFLFLLVFTIVFGTSYWYAETSAICPTPVAYRLGEFDNRFSIDQVTAKEVLINAEKVWEESVGQDLFVYDDKAEFAVNFIYDERQQLASTEEEWRTNLDLEESESRAAIEQVKALSVAYEAQQAAYGTERVEYDERLAKYNDLVAKQNEQGGASEAVFKELQAEQKVLKKLLDELISLEEELNKKAETINELGEKGNRLIEEYNAEVLKYNEIYGNIDLFTQGDFQRDRINIYKFSDVAELTKVIAHEFGHSLGVAHVEGEESIMYYLMAKQPDSITLTAEDRKGFVDTCGDGDGFAHNARRIIRNALTYL